MVLRWWTQAGLLALEAAATELDLSEAVVIMRNDARPSSSCATTRWAALRKGSFSCTFLQQCAMSCCRLERRVGCETLHLHAPSRTLIAEGVDDLSRATAEEVASRVGSAFLRQQATQLAQRHGWTLTVTLSHLHPTPPCLASLPASPSHKLRLRMLSRSATGAVLSAPPAGSPTGKFSSSFPLLIYSTASSSRLRQTGCGAAPLSSRPSPSPLRTGPSSCRRL